MKKTNRLLAALLAIAAVTATAPMSAFATNYNAEGDAQTNVTWTSNAAYVVTIPPSVALGETATVSASDVNLNAGEQLNVTLSGTSASGAFKLTTDTDELTYTVSKGTEDVAVGDVVLNVAAGTQTGSSTLTFNKPATTPNAGDYTGTVTFTVSVEDAAPANPYAAANVNDVVTFGNYSWYVIGKSDNGVTLLMENPLSTEKAYNENYASVTWESCTLRTYLNGTFYNTFSDEEKAKIVQKTNSNPNNPDYGTGGGNDTNDYIYLLSIDEANALDSNVRSCGSWWWLRTPGSHLDSAVTINDNGDVNAEGSTVIYDLGVRPALNLKF